jgi:hypothetical protein
MDCQTKKNLKSCNCTYEPCPRKGNCCQCLSYHRNMAELPAYVFPTDAEKTYDRSFGHFARLVVDNKI